MKGPENYLKPLGIELTCALRPGRSAVLDPTHRLEINQDIFFFADRGSLERFRKDPIRHCGRVTDPVSHIRFRPNRHSPRRQYGGRLYVFASDATRTAFAAMPDSYAVRRVEPMLPMAPPAPPGARPAGAPQGQPGSP